MSSATPASDGLTRFLFFMDLIEVFERMAGLQERMTLFAQRGLRLLLSMLEMPAWQVWRNRSLATASWERLVLPLIACGQPSRRMACISPLAVKSDLHPSSSP